MATPVTPPSAAAGTWPPRPDLAGVFSAHGSGGLDGWLQRWGGALLEGSDDLTAAGAIPSSSRASRDGVVGMVTGTLIGRNGRAISADDVIGAYLHRGLDGIGLVNGLSAAVVWDSRNRTVHLIRQPSGPPIFYRRQEGLWTWATRLDAVVMPGDSVDEVTIAEYLHWGNTQSPTTMVQEIERVPPGSVISIDATGVSVSDIWLPDWGERHIAPSRDERADEIHERLIASVRKWLSTAKGPPAILLSGGIDSVSLAVALTELGRDDITAFTVTFPGFSGVIDEFEEAHRVTTTLGIAHEPIILEPSFIRDYLDWIVAWYDEPVGYGLHTAELSAVSTSGHDLLFAGTGPDVWYPYAAEERWRWLTAVAPGPLRRLLLRGLGSFQELRGARGLHFALGLAEADVAETVADLGPDTPEDVLGMLGLDRGVVASAVTRRVDIMTARLDRLPFEDPVSLRAYGWTYLTYPDRSTYWIDRWCRAYGLTAALPHLDPALPAYLAQLRNLSPDRGEFRDMVSRALPHELAHNRKIGQGLPLAHWFGGELSDLLVDRLDPDARLASHLDMTAVARVVGGGSHDTSTNPWLVWKLLSLGAWLDHFDRVRRAVKPDAQGPR